MLDVFATAQAMQCKAVTDDLHNLGAGALSQGIGGLAAGKVAAILYGALDELVSFESLLGLLDECIGNIGFADVDNGVEMMDQCTELPDLLAIECHGTLAFCICEIRYRFTIAQGLNLGKEGSTESRGNPQVGFTSLNPAHDARRLVSMTVK